VEDMLKANKSQIQAFHIAADSGEVHQISKLDEAEQRARIYDQQTDTELKRKYANNFFWLLVAQLIVMNCVFVFVGKGLLNYTEMTLNLYMGGTLAEVFGVVLVITRYLFSKKYSSKLP
jgi:hypothetical protein